MESVEILKRTGILFCWLWGFDLLGAGGQTALLQAMKIAFRSFGVSPEVWDEWKQKVSDHYKVIYFIVIMASLAVAKFFIGYTWGEVTLVLWLMALYVEDPLFYIAMPLGANWIIHLLFGEWFYVPNGGKLIPLRISGWVGALVRYFSRFFMRQEKNFSFSRGQVFLMSGIGAVVYAFFVVFPEFLPF